MPKSMMFDVEIVVKMDVGFHHTNQEAIEEAIKRIGIKDPTIITRITVNCK
jgi:hypothetical protein